MASKGRLVFKLSHTAWSFCWAVAPAPEGLQTCHGWWRNRPCSHYWQSLSWNFVWKLAVTYICTQTHIYISINILYIIYSTVSIYIYIYTYIYTHTHNTHMFIDPYPRFQAMIIIFRNSKSHVDSSAPTGLPRARVPSQRPWKWVEETRSSHLGINGLPKPWWTSHVDEDYGKSCKRRSATECSRGTQPQVFIKENQLELELFLVAKASKRERFRGQILIPNKVL